MASRKGEMQKASPLAMPKGRKVRRISMRKSRIVAGFAAIAAAGSIAVPALVSSAPASAAVTTSAVVQVKPSVAPLFNRWHRVTINLSGTNWTGYWAYLVQHRDGLVTGWFYDGNADPTVVPGYMPINGTYEHGILQFNVLYKIGQQGDRGFLAVTAPHQQVSGIWQDTGPDAQAGTFTFTS